MSRMAIKVRPPDPAAGAAGASPATAAAVSTASQLHRQSAKGMRQAHQTEVAAATKQANLDTLFELASRSRARVANLQRVLLTRLLVQRRMASQPQLTSEALGGLDYTVLQRTKELPDDAALGAWNAQLDAARMLVRRYADEAGMRIHLQLREEDGSIMEEFVFEATAMRSSSLLAPVSVETRMQRARTMRSHWHAIVYAAGQSLMRPPAITRTEANELHVHVQGESIPSGALMEEEGVAAPAPTGSAASHSPLTLLLSGLPSLSGSVNWPGGWSHTELGEVDVGTWMVRVYHRRHCHALRPPTPSPANSSAAVGAQSTPDILRLHQLQRFEPFREAGAALNQSSPAAAADTRPSTPASRKRKAAGDAAGSSARRVPAAPPPPSPLSTLAEYVNSSQTAPPSRLRPLQVRSYRF